MILIIWFLVLSVWLILTAQAFLHKTLSYGYEQKNKMIRYFCLVNIVFVLLISTNFIYHYSVSKLDKNISISTIEFDKIYKSELINTYLINDSNGELYQIKVKNVYYGDSNHIIHYTRKSIKDDKDFWTDAKKDTYDLVITDPSVISEVPKVSN